MFITIDQTGNRIVVGDYPPKRIVSLVPSQTELLHYLGLEDEVVGITKFCVHPQIWFKTKTRVGGTKTVHIDAVKALKPDFIIANKEENVKEQVEALKDIAPVWVSDINNLADAMHMVKLIGELVNKKQKADALANQIQTNFSNLSEPPNYLLPLGPGHHPSTTYLIWREPYLTVGGDTFINDMITHCGFRNIFENEKRYPQISLQQLPSLNCQYVFLSSEPYPFKQKHAGEIQKILPGIKTIFVDGEMFSWYGSRLLLATQYFKELREHIYKRPEPYA